MRMFAQDRAFYRRIRVDGTDDAEAACRAFGVSRATYYEWRRRLKEGGVSGLVPHNSRPLRHAGRQWTTDDAARVLDVRRDMPWAGKARVADVGHAVTTLGLNPVRMVAVAWRKGMA